jgi:hypothetical protein
MYSSVNLLTFQRAIVAIFNIITEFKAEKLLKVFVCLFNFVLLRKDLNVMSLKDL